MFVWIVPTRLSVVGVPFADPALAMTAAAAAATAPAASAKREARTVGEACGHCDPPCWVRRSLSRHAG